jgi:RNA polymerase sigma factor (sigma-70 family)
VTDDDDWPLLLAWREGDRDAGNALVTRYIPVLQRFFANKLDGPIADLVQETFAACVAARDRIPDEIGFAPYLLGIARNHLLMLLREQRYARRHFTGPASTSVARRSATPSERLATQDEGELLLVALRQLPLEQQTLLELYYWEDLDVRQLAAVCELAPGTVKSRMSRARARLRTALLELGMDDVTATATLARLEAPASGRAP